MPQVTKKWQAKKKQKGEKDGNIFDLSKGNNTFCWYRNTEMYSLIKRATYKNKEPVSISFHVSRAMLDPLGSVLRYPTVQWPPYTG